MEIAEAVKKVAKLAYKKNWQKKHLIDPKNREGYQWVENSKKKYKELKKKGKRLKKENAKVVE